MILEMEDDLAPRLLRGAREGVTMQSKSEPGEYLTMLPAKFNLDDCILAVLVVFSVRPEMSDSLRFCLSPLKIASSRFEVRMGVFADSGVLSQVALDVDDDFSTEAISSISFIDRLVVGEDLFLLLPPSSPSKR